MSVRAVINGREFTLAWDEFERMIFRKGVTNAVTILEVRE